MLITIVAITAIAVIALVSLQAAGDRMPNRAPVAQPLPSSALDLARERLARGEITPREYEALERTLLGR